MERMRMTSPHGGSRLGTRFGPYELNSLIGVGGMGEVYRAYDTIKDRTVALKVLRAEMAADPNYQERFRRESRMAARLQEPHVIPVHDFGDIDGALYIHMRLVEGASLKARLRGTARSPRVGPRRSSRRWVRHWTPRTRTAWCIGTSNRRMSCSHRMTSPTSSTSGSPTAAATRA